MKELPFFDSAAIDGKEDKILQILPEHFTGEDHNIKCSSLEKFIVKFSS